MLGYVLKKVLLSKKKGLTRSSLFSNVLYGLLSIRDAYVQIPTKVATQSEAKLPLHLS